LTSAGASDIKGQNSEIKATGRFFKTESYLQVISEKIRTA
jgi:hypothetical protein